MKIKLDENLPDRLVAVLTGLGHDVDTVRGEQLIGRVDSDVWNAAQAAQRFLVTQDLDFSDTGVAYRDHRFQDDGRFEVTGRESDRGAFKTPTLRDVALTAPYMHDGSLATLQDVIEFYSEGGRPNPNLDINVRPLNLTTREKAALVAMLHTLTGAPRQGLTR